MNEQSAPPIRFRNARQRKILELVRRRGFAAFEALAEEFGVTARTIRRDVNGLCRQDLLRRHRNGAGLPSSVENLDYATRQLLCLDEKLAIARLLAKQVPDGSSLFLSNGTTNEEVARALLDHRGLRVITNNLTVASLMSANPDFEVMVAGGKVQARDAGTVGEAAIDQIRRFRADYGIIGVGGIEADGTLVDFDEREVRVVQAMMAQSRQVYLAADHSKFGRAAMVRLGEIGEVDALFTDRSPPRALELRMIGHGTRLYVADAAGAALL